MDFLGELGGPGGLLAHFAQGLQAGPMPRLRRLHPRAYDEYLKAYSVAMLRGRERTNVSYGGKIIMPPSALATLTSLDLESPWMFQLRNPSNSAASTHAGVLEFIAEEGIVYLPYWMMKTLRLEEGDPVRITGAELPKGKLVKLQAQSVHFLEISDPRAVLEQALRNFSALTQGDIIEISYNSIIFGLLVMETQPGGAGISVLDTDLEVDFAPPVGYVEPERPKAAPPSTMASKLKIDLNSSSPGSSRPASSMSGGFAASNGTVVSKGGDQWESFKGKGETLSGRKTKGRGISHRKVEQVPEGSKIIRTDQHRIVSNTTIESDSKVPAPLNLPFGQLFFGFHVATYELPTQSGPSPEAVGSQPTAFGGVGQAVGGSSSSKGKEKEKDAASTKPPASTPSSAHSWGTGHTLGSPSGNLSMRPNTGGPVGAGGARVPRPPVRNTRKPQQPQRSPTPDWGVEDDDVIMVDSD